MVKPGTQAGRSANNNGRFAFIRKAMLHNKPLVPTRTGEAPVLAAQQRR